MYGKKQGKSELLFFSFLFFPFLLFSLLSFSFLFFQLFKIFLLKHVGAGFSGLSESPAGPCSELSAASYQQRVIYSLHFALPHQVCIDAMSSRIRLAFLCVLLLGVLSISLHNNLDQYGVLGPGSWTDDGPIEKLLQIERTKSDSLAKSQEVEVGACILIMDGNHYLIEWLAYHYHAANLRHLIIHSDKNSATSPSEVLNRWRDRITIQEWNETDFLDESKYKDLGGSYEMHLERQQIFYLECMKDLQRQGRDWALLADPDEYLMIEEPNNASSNSTPTLLKSFQSFQIPFGLNITYNPCIPIRRRQFTMDESKNEIVQSMTPPGFDGRSFQTLRWRKLYFEDKHYTTKSGETCLVTEKFNRIPNKVIVDLHRLNPKELSNLFARATVHRPLEICPNAYFEKTPFVLNHYSGTKEQWLSRSNDGRGKNHRIFCLTSLGWLEERETMSRPSPHCKSCSNYYRFGGSDSQVRVFSFIKGKSRGRLHSFMAEGFCGRGRNG